MGDDPPSAASIQNKINQIIMSVNTKFIEILSYFDDHIKYNLTYTNIPNVVLVNNNNSTITNTITNFFNIMQEKNIYHFQSLYKTTYSQDINIEFQPDKVILKYITITNKNPNETPGILLLCSNLIPNQSLISIPNSIHYSESVDIPFKTHGPINSSYDFYLRTMGNRSINKNFANIMFSLTFIFIKYKNLIK